MSAVIKSENQEVVVLNTLQHALEKGVDADSLEKLLNMQERVLDRQSEQAYAQSMVEVQMKMPAITQNCTNEQTRSSYSDMGQILKQITPVYTAAGFAVSFGNGKAQEANEVRVTCDVMHSQGHSKPYYIDIPLDMAGIKGQVNKTAVHGTASAISYGQRYLIKLIFNLNTTDDDDGNAAGGDTRSAIDVDNEWISRMSILKTLIPTLMQVKESLRDKDYQLFFQAWSELSKAELNAIWHPAPTKGGVLTTEERDLIRSSECQAVAKEIRYSTPT
jgi:hypothetical protein